VAHEPPAPAADGPAADSVLGRASAPAQDSAPAGGPAAAVSAAPDGPLAQPRGGTDPVVLLIALAAFAAYTTLSVAKYLRLEPGSWDLGIFTEYVRQAAGLHAPTVSIRGAGFNLLGDHFQPIVMLLAPVFRLFPTPVTLLVAQALLTAVSVVPLCRAAAELLGTAASRAVGVAYGFSWGLAQMIDFDFHEVAFAVPLLAFSLSALVRRRRAAAAAWALPLVFVKEDQGFTVAAIGLAMAGIAAVGRIREHRAAQLPAPGTGDSAPGKWAPGGRAPGEWARTGLLLACWGVGWSLLAIYVLIPHFNAAHQYPYWSFGGTVSPGGHASASAVAHQLTAGGSQKLATTLLVLAPTAFLALRSPFALIAVPSLALRFVSTNTYFWGTGYHYSATVMPIVFAAAIDGMARLTAGAREAQPGESRPGRLAGWPRQAGVLAGRYGAVAMLAVTAWLAVRFPLAGLWTPATYTISPHVQAERAAMARVPGGASVETTLTMLAALAARHDTYWIGTSGNPPPSYVVFDEDNSGWSPPPPDPLVLIQQQNPGTAYRQIFVENNVYVFRRTTATGG
jgi:uncharacterized membrane protein